MFKVGEYIRTPFGIRKIINITSDDGYGKSRVKVIELDEILDTHYKYSYTFYTDEKVMKEAKHSFNIIDLIEVGDYVNGHKVLDIAQAPIRALYLEDISQTGALIPVCDYQIKSIVTKEQFESMEYKVGD